MTQYTVNGPYKIKHIWVNCCLDKQSFEWILFLLNLMLLGLEFLVDCPAIFLKRSIILAASRENASCFSHPAILIPKPICGSKTLRIQLKFRFGGIFMIFYTSIRSKSIIKTFLKMIQTLIRVKMFGLTDDWGRTWKLMCFDEELTRMYFSNSASRMICFRTFIYYLSFFIQSFNQSNCLTVHSFPFLRQKTEFIYDKQNLFTTKIFTTNN